jgi:gluconolactonase
MTVPATLPRGPERGALAPAQPDRPRIAAYDPEFEAVLGDDPRLELVAETDAHEGPVYAPGEDVLYFTTLPRPGNSPAPGTPQAVIKIWFTDPSYGYLQGFRPEPQLGDYVYRFDPASGRLSVVADCCDKPNGLAFSPDGRILYVTDSGANQELGSYHVRRPHHIVAFDVRDGAHLAGGRLFAVTSPGFPDGIKVDPAGRVYASSFGGVDVFSRAGDLIGRIVLPGAVNFTFGGPGGRALFITTDAGVWAAVLDPAAGTSQRPDQAPERW